MHSLALPKFLLLFLSLTLSAHARPIKLQFRDRTDPIMVSETALFEHVDPDGLLALILKKNAESDIILVPSRGDLFQRYTANIIEKGRGVHLDPNIIPELLEECEFLGLPKVCTYVEHYAQVERSNKLFRENIDPTDPDSPVKKDLRAIVKGFPLKPRARPLLEKIIDFLVMDDSRELQKIILTEQLNVEDTLIPFHQHKILEGYRVDGTQGMTLATIAVLMGSLNCLRMLWLLGADIQSYKNNYSGVLGNFGKGPMEQAGAINKPTLALLSELKNSSRDEPEPERELPKKHLDINRLYRLLDMNPEVLPQMLKKQVDEIREENMLLEKRSHELARRLKDDEEQLALLSERTDEEIKKRFLKIKNENTEGRLVIHPIQGIEKNHVLYKRVEALIASAVTLATFYPSPDKQPNIEITPSIGFIYEDGYRFKFFIGARIVIATSTIHREKPILIEGLKTQGNFMPITRRNSSLKKVEPLRELSSEIASTVNELKESNLFK